MRPRAQSGSAQTVVDEGRAFIGRNAEALGGAGSAAAELGGLVWGLLRAVAECPNCPGVFRVPVDEDWTALVCPACGGVWVQT